MIKNGISGPETCTEVFNPYYSYTPYFGAMARLESAINSGNPDEIGTALKIRDVESKTVSAIIEFAEAPKHVQSLDLCMVEAAKIIMTDAGVDPDIYLR